jgi:hypothetical protein
MKKYPSKTKVAELQVNRRTAIDRLKQYKQKLIKYLIDYKIEKNTITVKGTHSLFTA